MSFRSMLLPLCAASALAFASGCANIEVATAGGADAVVVENSGCYLFYCIPLFSGDPDYPNRQVCSWFTNTVNIETNMRLLKDEMENQGALGVRNVASRYISEPIIFLLLKREVLQTSAELVR
ncbi:MAG: hypothetical protein IKE55_07635 [Kiritimatiellae bacterium]|nr:hypothetical protein [Kiritimatiellia bacterium]